MIGLCKLLGSEEENGEGHRIVILIQSYNFQVGEEPLAITQKQAAAPYFTEHQVAELLFLSHFPLTNSKFRNFSKEKQLLALDVHKL